ncbi:MAG: peptidase S41, partial [Nitrospinae bacterium]|nr:peptidase S41 [Nitrospinota bacterium]
MFKRCLNILTLVLPAFFLFFFLSGGRFPAGFSLAHAGFFDFDLEIFEETLDLVEEKYVYPPDFKNLFSAAIEQMVKSADPENLSADAAAGSVLYKNQSRLKFRLDYNRDNDTEAFKKVYYFLLDQYKGRVSKKDLEMAAIDGFVNALDPYSQYMDKETFDKSMKDTEGKYGGVGMVISMRDYKLVVVKTMKNSPAERAGILPDDVFAKVDGRETKGLQI